MRAEEAIRRRRSARKHLRKPITLDQLSQILWAAQGIIDTQRGYRVAPSPEAKYTLELYVFTRERVSNGTSGEEAYCGKPSQRDLFVNWLILYDVMREMITRCNNKPAKPKGF